MPCHGDHGQGLTDEFRELWVEDHQNCWGRGCHGGKWANDSFTVPTFIPPVAREDELAQFQSEQELFDYLKATHPPQDPGLLENEEYHAISSFVFEMNHRPTTSSTPLPSLSTVPSLPPPGTESSTQSLSNLLWPGMAGVFILLAIILIVRKSR